MKIKSKEFPKGRNSWRHEIEKIQLALALAGGLIGYLIFMGFSPKILRSILAKTTFLFKFRALCSGCGDTTGGKI